MKKLSLLNKILLVLGFTSALISVVTFVCALTNGDRFTKVMMFVITVLLLVLSLFITYLVFVGLKVPSANRTSALTVNRNYFLFPKGQKKPILKEQLTYEQVDVALVRYIKAKFGNAVYLWQNDIFSEFDDSKREQTMSVLVAYKMLVDLIQNEKVYRLFYGISFEELLGLCERLRLNGDDELSDRIREWRENGDSTVKEASEFLSVNENYIKKRMVILVRRKAELFDE